MNISMLSPLLTPVREAFRTSWDLLPELKVKQVPYEGEKFSLQYLC